jgi:hypothetical protein
MIPEENFGPPHSTGKNSAKRARRVENSVISLARSAAAKGDIKYAAPGTVEKKHDDAAQSRMDT